MLIQDYKRLFESNSEVKAIYLKGQKVWPTAHLTLDEKYFWMYNKNDTPIELKFEKYPSTAPSATLYYSLDHVNWQQWCNPSSTTAQTLTIPARTRYFVRTTDRLTNTNGGTNTFWSSPTDNPGLVIGGYLDYISGPTLNSLDNYSAQKYMFANLFEDCRELYDASNLKFILHYSTILPTLPVEVDLDYQFSNTFAHCENLVLPPEYIYQECWAVYQSETGSRTVYYNIHAREYQYFRMFDHCTSLIKTPNIRAVKPRYGRNVSDPEMGRVYTASESKLCGKYSFSRMFDNCSSLKDIYFYSAINRSGFTDTFYYSGVDFRAAFSYDSTSNLSTNMFRNVPATGTVHLISGLDSSYFPSGADGIPEGWTVVEQ